MNNLIPVNEIQTMAIAVAKSGLFGVKEPNQALALMLVAQAEGRHPALAARDYDIIQGRPAKKAEAMLRDFIESGGKVEWHKLDDAIADATFSHPGGGSIRIDWTMDRAKSAGLGGKDMWKKYPRQMLRSRVISEGIRTVCPMATSGMYVPEEVQDFHPEEKDITPVPSPEKKAENISKAKAAIKPKQVEAKTITGNPEEGSLPPMKPLQADIDKMLAAFAMIEMNEEMIGSEYGKPVADWTIEDMSEAREWFKIRKQDWDLKQMELKSTKEVI